MALNAEFIGINNRNLSTFETTLQHLDRPVAGGVPQGVHLVSESGITTHADVVKSSTQAGIGTFLVGESLMRQDDVTKAHPAQAAGATGRPMSQTLTHLNERGEAHIVDIGGKASHARAGPSRRRGKIEAKPETVER